MVAKQFSQQLWSLIDLAREICSDERAIKSFSLDNIKCEKWARLRLIRKCFEDKVPKIYLLKNR